MAMHITCFILVESLIISKLSVKVLIFLCRPSIKSNSKHGAQPPKTRPIGPDGVNQLTLTSTFDPLTLPFLTSKMPRGLYLVLFVSSQFIPRASGFEPRATRSRGSWAIQFTFPKQNKRNSKSWLSIKSVTFSSSEICRENKVWHQFRQISSFWLLQRFLCVWGGRLRKRERQIERVR